MFFILLFFSNLKIDVAKSLNSKIFVTDQKRAMLDSFRDEELNALLTNQPRDAQVHVVPLWHVLPEVFNFLYIAVVCMGVYIYLTIILK